MSTSQLRTVIDVTHDRVEAMTMGQRIVVMKGGLIQQVADPCTGRLLRTHDGGTCGTRLRPGERAKYPYLSAEMQVFARLCEACRGRESNPHEVALARF
jgi:ABC-type nitrate/sulfonate/bicarbonate transport system ATPase subunit